MASTNGALSPSAQPQHADTANISSAKRKREDSLDGHNQINGITSSSETKPALHFTTENPDSLVRDLVDVLKSHDTFPSVLNTPLSEQASSLEPQAKRPRGESSSILERYSSRAYSKADEVLRDVDLAVTIVLEKFQLSRNPGRTQNIPLPVQHAEIYAKLLAFQKYAHQLVRSETAVASRKSDLSIGGSLNGSEHRTISNATNSEALLRPEPRESKTILTLLGNGGRQMFSSFQRPIKVNGEDVHLPVREAGLPNGITAARVLATKSSALIEEKKRIQTLGDLFPTPSSIPQMQPPNPSKNAITRSSTVKWYQPDPSDGESRYGGYARQNIYVGHWLDYSGSSSLGAKRKQRDRALSLTGKITPKDLEQVESESEKLDSLFRSAYSGFAPSKDDTQAIVPESQLSRIWWQRTGEVTFDKMLKIADDDAPTDSSISGAKVEMAQFEKAVEDWEPDVIDPDLPSTTIKFETPAADKDLQEVLQGISELLESLNSYQRIRHMTLNNSSRPPGILSAPDTTALGTPTNPSESELATYEILKSQLIILISTLPPYALAKLDSTQLGELGISTRIEVQLDDHKGVMEEDDASARARNAALNAASNTQPRATPAAVQHRPSTNSPYSSQFASPRAPSVSNHYMGSSQTPARAAQPSAHRPPPASTPSAYQPPRNASTSTSYRPNGYGVPNYQQPSSRPFQQYANTPATNQSYSATRLTPNYTRTGGQIYQPTQAQSFLNRYSQQTYTQPRTAQNGYQYGQGHYYQSQQSPSQSAMFSPGMQSTQHRQSYSHSPTPPLQDRRNSYMSASITGNPVINGGRPSPSPQMPQTNATSFNTWMNPKQQAEMLERQRAQAQLAQQQGAQYQARVAGQASAAGSPSPQVNGNPITTGL